jgi:hypothetical protein
MTPETAEFLAMFFILLAACGQLASSASRRLRKNNDDT